VVGVRAGGRERTAPSSESRGEEAEVDYMRQRIGFRRGDGIAGGIDDVEDVRLGVGMESEEGNMFQFVCVCVCMCMFVCVDVYGVVRICVFV